MWRRHLVVLCVITFSSCLRAAENETIELCGRGPPPGSAEFQSFEAARDIQRQRLGYDLVCDDLLRFMNREMARATDYGSVVSQLEFEPLDLSNTPFAAYRFLGAAADFFTDNKPAAMWRFFQMPSGQILQLMERDLSLGGGVYVDPARLTARVGQRRAQLIILQSKSGQALSILRWGQNQRWIELHVNASAAVGNWGAELIRLAESLPPAKPARAKGAVAPRPADWPEPLPWPLPEPPESFPPGWTGVPADTD